VFGFGEQDWHSSHEQLLPLVFTLCDVFDRNTEDIVQLVSEGH